MGAIARTFEPGLDGVYDSAHRESPVAKELRELWRRRGLLRLLVARDVVLRYKRSLLGVWWALLNPLLRLGVIWVVMAAVFRPQLPGVPYVVYLFSGIVVITFFEQAVTSAGSSLINGSAILSKVYVPPMCFAASSVGAAMVTFVLSLIPLLIIQLATGIGLPWTVILLPAPMLALLALATGVGLVVASVAVRFHDAVDITAVLIQITAFAAPVFYPLSAVPSSLRVLIELNPLTQIMLLERALLYGGTLGAWQNWVGSFGSAVVALTGGIFVFARGWEQSAVML